MWLLEGPLPVEGELCGAAGDEGGEAVDEDVGLGVEAEALSFEEDEDGFFVGRKSPPDGLAG